MPRSVCPRQKSHCCQSASGNPRESSEIVPQQLLIARSAGLDAELCFGRLEFHQVSRHVFHFVCQSHRCRLSVTPQPYVFVKEFEQSSGRKVRGLLSQNRNDFHSKQVSVDSNESRGIFLFCFSTNRRCLHECEVKCDHRELFSPRASHCGDVVFPTSHDT